MTKKPVKQLTFREYSGALLRTLKMAYRASPAAVGLRIVDIIIGAIFPLAVTILAAATTTKLVDAFTGAPGAKDAAITLVIITSLIGLLQITWVYISGYIDRIIRYKISLGISTEMYERFVRLDFWRYDDKETISTYEKANRFSNYFPYIFTNIGRIMSDVIAVIVSIIALAYVAPWLSLIMLASVVPGAIVQISIARKQALHWSENVQTRREAGYIEYNLLQPDTIAELRIYKLAKFMLGKRKQLVEADERGNLEIERYYISRQLASGALLSIAEVVALVWIVVLIANRQQPVGQFVYVQQMVSRAMAAASGIAGSLGSLDEDLANLADYDKFMNMSLQDVKHPTIDTFSSLEVQNATFKYPGSSRTTLKNISMTIPAGKHIAIVGENGAGKTTLIKLLLGLYHPTKGSVLVNGKDLKDYNIESWHAQLAVLLQSFTRYNNSTIENNIIYGDVTKKQTNVSIKDAAIKSESDEFINKLAHKYKTPTANWFADDDEEGAMLSGGQWQRLALARNFYRSAPIIILDEPTSAIDALAESRIFKRLLSKDNKQTIITISHRLTTVERADIIYVFKDGRVAEAGTHRELVDKSGEYARMFADQLHHDV